MASITFHGATREVTGSMHVLEVDGFRVALDCGLFQGRRAEARTKNLEFQCDPAKIDAVIISHAHIDHSGRLPRLVKQGYDGPIYMTPASRDLAAVMLNDSAHIQEEDAAYWNRKRVKRGDEPIEPLYERDDAIQAVEQIFGIPYDRPMYLAPRIQFRFVNSGHMLGSGMVHIEVGGNGEEGFSLLYTGDVGRPGVPILKDPKPLPASDYLICESTYGGRSTPPVPDMKDRLAEVVQNTVKRGGKVIVPSFSVGRTQTIVYNLHQLFTDGVIEELPVYVDSPLAVNATEVFRLHPECYDSDAREFNSRVGDMLANGSCRYIRDVEESKALHQRREPCVIISASGMCEFGRILHHLKNNIGNKKNTVLIVGFQAEHTAGRRIVEGADEIKIFGKMYRLRADVVVLNGFSSHADSGELKDLTAPLAESCRHAFIVHGELDQSEALRTTLEALGFGNVDIPTSGQNFDLV